MQDRRDEEPNKELARELVQTNNIEGIQEVAENLWNKDKKIQSDCDGVTCSSGGGPNEFGAQPVGWVVVFLHLW